MNISRHNVEREDLPEFFRQQHQGMLVRVDLARRSSDVLSGLAGFAQLTYKAGSVVAPDSPEVTQALRLAAQANTATLVFARVEDPPRYLPVGDGPAVTYATSVDASLVHPYRWADAFHEAVVSRLPGVVEALLTVTENHLKDSPTRGEQGAYDYAEMRRALWMNPSAFTQTPAFVAQESSYLDALEQGRLGIGPQRLGVPYFAVLRHLEAGDEAGFAEALAEALNQHKRYWSGTEKRRRNLEGYVSLMLTATAALAWDRGMRFDVQSDYMPQSWVTGELFRRGPGG